MIMRMADRRLGIGCDQVLGVAPHAQCDAHYRVWNQDGTQAGQCGNGALAVMRHLRRSHPQASTLCIEGRTLRANPAGAVQLGEVRSQRLAQGLYAVDVGNPHLVSVAKAPLATLDLPTQAQTLERQVGYAANVSVIEKVEKGYRVRIHERGVGETLACGSAAMAIAAALNEDVSLFFPGGALKVSRSDGAWWLDGPVTYVGQGQWAESLY